MNSRLPKTFALVGAFALVAISPAAVATAEQSSGASGPLTFLFASPGGDNQITLFQNSSESSSAPGVSAAAASISCNPVAYAYNKPGSPLVAWDVRGECSTKIARIGVQGQLKKGSTSYGSFHEAATNTSSFGQPRTAKCAGGNCKGIWTLAASIRFSPKSGQSIKDPDGNGNNCVKGGDGGYLCRDLQSLYFK